MTSNFAAENGGSCAISGAEWGDQKIIHHKKEILQETR